MAKTDRRRIAFYFASKVFRASVLGGVLGALAGAVSAGSPLGELEYRFPCELPTGRAEIQYTERYAATVGVSLDFGPDPVLVVNERQAFEQPSEVVAFEYFSACEQARQLHRERSPRSMLSYPASERFLGESDCRALASMRREGVVRGSEAASTIIEVFRYWRAKETYLDVPFEVRAEYVQRNCPY